MRIITTANCSRRAMSTDSRFSRTLDRNENKVGPRLRLMKKVYPEFSAPPDITNSEVVKAPHLHQSLWRR